VTKTTRRKAGRDLVHLTIAVPRDLPSVIKQIARYERRPQAHIWRALLVLGLGTYERLRPPTNG